MTIVMLLTMEDAKNLVQQRVAIIDNETFYNIHIKHMNSQKCYSS